MSDTKRKVYSAFNLKGDGGYQEYIEQLYGEVQSLYQEDPHPWVIGYSGGKDSTAVLQLIWLALEKLSPEVRNSKKVHVISTDTLVENPAVAVWVGNSLRLINDKAQEKKMPFEAHLLHPDKKDSFWELGGQYTWELGGQYT